jgi:hypothetical protein
MVGTTRHGAILNGQIHAWKDNMGPTIVEGNHVVSVESRTYTMGPVVHHHRDISHEPVAGTGVTDDRM